jgi:hypothetical protein
MTSKVLAKFSSDWADEFTAEGLAIMTRDEYDNLLANAAAGKGWFFGTNEGWEDGEDLSDQFTFKYISEEEEAVLIKTIPDLKPGNSFGQFPTHWIYDDPESDY